MNHDDAGEAWNSNSGMPGPARRQAAQMHLPFGKAHESAFDLAGSFPCAARLTAGPAISEAKATVSNRRIGGAALARIDAKAGR